MKVTPLQFIVMIQLIDGPKYGYEILKNIREDFSDSWSPQTGTIYPALKSMIKKGLIEKKEVNERIFYFISKTNENNLNDVENYVAEFLAMANKFIESVLKRIPSSFAHRIFDTILKTETMELIPEYVFVNESNRITKIEQRKEILLMRKKTIK